MSHDQNLREWSKTVILSFTICLNCEIREWQLLLFSWIVNEKMIKFLCDFTWNCKNLRESCVKGISQFRTEVKRDSVKCWSVNFPWTWIHWPITDLEHCTWSLMILLTLCSSTSLLNSRSSAISSSIQSGCIPWKTKLNGPLSINSFLCWWVRPEVAI